MFHIVTPDGITVTENGCQTLFVPKTHEDYQEILENINQMDYWAVQSYIDSKARLQSLISEDAEVYFNSEDDLEVSINQLKDEHKSDLKALVISYLKSIIEDREDEDKEKEREVEKVSKLIAGLHLSKVKIVFE